MDIGYALQIVIPLSASAAAFAAATVKARKMQRRATAPASAEASEMSLVSKRNVPEMPQDYLDILVDEALHHVHELTLNESAADVASSNSEALQRVAAQLERLRQLHRDAKEEEAKEWRLILRVLIAEVITKESSTDIKIKRVLNPLLAELKGEVQK